MNGEGCAYPSEDDWIPISALEHFSYCPRQYGLIHIEQVFDENIYTQRGRYVHERVHEEATRGNAVRVEFGLPLLSRRLGLAGKADLVEFHGKVACPVEYKYGPEAGTAHADIQVCAQAICLEEMLGIAIPTGAVFHHATRRRREIALTVELRARVEEITTAIRNLNWRGRLADPLADSRCRNCSLDDACLPFVVSRPARLAALSAELFTLEECHD